ncbi:MAG: hypothetical protein V3T30_03325 [Thermodesulfobacteriota bacterium]
MNKLKNLLYFSVGTVVMIGLITYFYRPASYEHDFTDIPERRSKLIDGTISYQSVEEVKARFTAEWGGARAAWDVLQDISLSEDDKRPPFSVYEASIDRYIHMEVAGVLTLKFFNDRLMETVFYPTDPGRYLDGLAKNKNKEDLRFRREHRRMPYTRIWKETDWKRRVLVRYFDIRLAREMDAWKKKYSEESTTSKGGKAIKGHPVTTH